MKRRWLWAGAAALGLATGLYIGLPYLLVQRLGLGTVRRGPLAGRRVALTFDDGPDPAHTPAVLDALQEAGMQATFFVLAEAAEQHPDLLQRIGAEGHEIGVHAAQHRHAWVRTPLDAYRDPIRAARALERLGLHPRWGRPPHGAYTLATLAGMRQAGLIPVHWSIEGGDWRPGAAPAEVTRRILDELHGGAVTVLHDSGPGARVTPKALPSLLAGMQARGFRSVTLSELGAQPLKGRDIPARLMAQLDTRLDRALGIRPALGRREGLFRLQAARFPLPGLRWPDGTPIPRGTPALEFHVNNPLLVELGLQKFIPRARQELRWVAQEWAAQGDQDERGEQGRPDYARAQYLYCLSVHGPVLARLGLTSVPLAPFDAWRLKLWSDVMHRAYGTAPRRAAPVLSIITREDFMRRYGGAASLSLESSKE